jgi:hypothetical protein
MSKIMLYVSIYNSLRLTAHFWVSSMSRCSLSFCHIRNLNALLSILLPLSSAITNKDVHFRKEKSKQLLKDQIHAQASCLSIWSPAEPWVSAAWRGRGHTHYVFYYCFTFSTSSPLTISFFWKGMSQKCLLVGSGAIHWDTNNDLSFIVQPLGIKIQSVLL